MVRNGYTTLVDFLKVVLSLNSLSKQLMEIRAKTTHSQVLSINR